MNILTTDTIGDIDEYPVIGRLVDLLNKENNPKINRIVLRTINTYHKRLNDIAMVDTETRKYLMNLIREDFLIRVIDSTIMLNEIKSLICTLICGIHNNTYKRL